jgi:hypothetical protein
MTQGLVTEHYSSFIKLYISFQHSEHWASAMCLSTVSVKNVYIKAKNNTKEWDADLNNLCINI